MAVVLDSDAVIGFLDAGDALHGAADAKVRGLLKDGEPLFVSAVTFAEVLTGAKLGHHPEQDVRGFFEHVVSEILPITTDVAEQAADLRARLKSLKMPDALILACAEASPDVELVVCGDERATRVPGLSCAVELLVR